MKQNDPNQTNLAETLY